MNNSTRAISSISTDTRNNFDAHTTYQIGMPVFSVSNYLLDPSRARDTTNSSGDKGIQIQKFRDRFQFVFSMTPMKVSIILIMA